MKPFLISLLVGLVTFLAFYVLLGGSQRSAKGNENDRPLQQHIEEVGKDDDAAFVSRTQTFNAGNIELDPNSEEYKIERLRQKLQPKSIIDEDGSLVKHQFLHLHHMKTGGTCKSLIRRKIERTLIFHVEYY